MERCPVCPGLNYVIPPSGPVRCDVMCIGEAPGAEENKKGECFVGKTGMEYDRTYLPLAGLKRHQINTTNAMKCLPGGNGKLDPKNAKDQALIRGCMDHHLKRELRTVQPKVIVSMGAVASLLLPGIDLETHNGFPFDISIDDRSYVLFPTYHPAGGLHDHKKMRPIRSSYIRLGKYLSGQLQIQDDEYPTPDYRVVAGRGEVRQLDRRVPIAIDTETMRGGGPFCLTYSVQPGTGRLIATKDEESIAAFAAAMDSWEGPILIHNSLFDLTVLEAMGVVVPWKRLVDTMMRLYHMQNQEQGLKVAAYRHLGMDMQDFNDLVAPYSTVKVLDYYEAMAAEKWERPEASLVRKPDGKLKLYQPQSLNTKLKVFYTYLKKNPDKDVFESWKNWEDHHVEVETRLGQRWPGKCITHVPFEKVLFYACRDADATLRLWPRLQAARRRIRNTPEFEWMEAA